MRIESVTAHRFGPLAGRRLTLAPGLTVIYGPNEAGKSSWHVALTAALCGMRRGAGRGSRAEQQFIARYRPWPEALDPTVAEALEPAGSWAVGCELTLVDGRRIEIRRDLAARIATVTDIAVGRDVAAEVMHEGAPDAARWLGLDRHLFALTASATQASTLAVVEAADGLQEHLQRAMAAGDAESSGPGVGTAAAALALLESCQRERVGADRQGSNKPLRAGREAVAAADRCLREARAAHQEQQQLAQQVERCREAAFSADRLVDEWEARWDAAQHAEAGRPPAPQPAPEMHQPSSPRRRLLTAPLLAGWLAATVLAFGVGLLLVGAAIGLVLAAAVLGVGAWRIGAAQRGLSPPRQPDRVNGRSGDVVLPNADQGLLETELTSRRAREARRAATAAASALAAAEAVLVERRRASPSVPEAEERSAQADAELRRVERLAETLRLTSEFLGQAQDTVQRQAAPQIAATMQQWLPALTGGRYRDPVVDPATLQVSVRDPGGVLRRAGGLSHGTAEQVHLLLRVALVRHLTAAHEPAPLLFDEVTVHADPDRLERLLMVLHDVSVEQQVVLFTQQASVRLWAEQALLPECDKLITLDRPSTRPAAMMIVRDAAADVPC